MAVDPMWAGQYLLLDELWRGRERIMFDPTLSQLILAPGGDQLPWDREGRVHDLLESLLAQDSAGVWILFEDLQKVARAGVDPSLFGARALADGPLLAHRRHWEVAMIDATRLLDAMGAWPADLDEPPEPLPPEASLVDALMASLDPSRTLVLWTRADSQDPKDSARLAALSRLCSAQTAPWPGPAQLIGLSHTPTMQAFALGTERGAEDTIEVDHRLGTDHPDLRYFMAVVGPRLPPGVTVLELPDAQRHEGSAQDHGQAPHHLADRRALHDRLEYLEQELAASEQQRQDLERDLDRASQRVVQLEQGERPQGPERAPSPEQSEDATPPDEALEKALLLQASWEIEQLREQLCALRARPVSELEAENARLCSALGSLSSPQAIKARLGGAHDEFAANQGPSGAFTLSAALPASAWVDKALAPAPPRAGRVGAQQGAALANVEAFEPNAGELAGAAQDPLAASARRGRAPWQTEPKHAALRQWEPELCAMAGQLRALRMRLERGGVEPLRLQSKLYELERGVARILRDLSIGKGGEDVSPLRKDHKLR